MRIAETKKDTYEFKRDIIIGAENPRTGKIAGEKMIRWVEGGGGFGAEERLCALCLGHACFTYGCQYQKLLGPT